MRARTMLATLMLGASLLGAYLALAQESPRPRPVAPPEVGDDVFIVNPVELRSITSGTIERDRPAPADKTPKRDAAPLSEPAEPPVRREKKSEPPAPLPDLPAVSLPDLPAVLPAVLPAGGVPPLPLGDLAPPPVMPPATPPAKESLPIAPPVAVDQAAPPPLPPIPPPMDIGPVEVVPPPAPKTNSPPRPVEPKRTAPVTPWTPKDKSDDAPPRRVQNTPPSPPSDPPAERPSRFVVPRSGTTRPTEPRPQVVDTGVEAPKLAPAEGPQVRRLDQVKIFHAQSASPVQGTPTGLERFMPPSPAGLTTSTEVGSASTVTPQLTIEKRGPFYQKAGATLAYQILLRNIGSTTAVQVRIEDEIPGMTRRSAIPAPVYEQGNRLAWVVPTLRPGEEKMFLLELVPNRPGDLVSTTSVVITQSTSFRTKQEDDGSPFPTPLPSPTPTPAPLTFDTPPPTPTPAPGPGPALITTPAAPFTLDVKPVPVTTVGQKVTLEVVITNKGTSPLTQLMLIGALPPGLKHPAGDSIGADLPDLAPGESKTFKMPVTAAQPGNHLVEIRLKTKDSEVVTRPTVEVIGPAANSTSNAVPTNLQQMSAQGLQVQIQGRDEKVSVGKETVVVINVANLGFNPASNVQVTLFLSDGLEATTNAQAPTAYRLAGRRVSFESIASLKETGTLNFHLGVRAVGVGEQQVRVQVSSDQERTPVFRDFRVNVVR